jgi:hypothetical protein
VDEAPAGPGRVHEIKYDGYRMHARIALHADSELVAFLSCALASAPGLSSRLRHRLERPLDQLPHGFTAVDCVLSGVGIDRGGGRGRHSTCDQHSSPLGLRRPS